MNITLKELITSFTKSIDLYNYLLKNHHRRTAIAAFHIGVEMGLSADRIIQILQDEFLTKHGEPVYQVILNHLDELETICKVSVQDGIARFHCYQNLADTQEQLIKERVNR